MSQHPLQQPPRTYSPWQQTQTPDSFAPPAKRQRLDQRLDSAPGSPFNQSPFGSYNNSPSISNIALPNAYNPQRPANGSPAAFSSGVNQLAPRVMGPPQRPAERGGERLEEKQEKDMDITDQLDLVTSSGIDLREEENYMAASYRSDRNNAFQPTHTAHPQSSFDLLSQSSFGAIGSRGGPEPPQQMPAKTPEQELYEKHKKAARAVNESQQHHLENPFLQGNAVRHRLEKIGNDNGVRLPLEGLFDRVSDRPQSILGLSMTSADGSGLVVAQAPSVLNRNTPLEPLLSLLSLAANDRIRGLLEDAHGLARGRQFSSDGLVPPEWSNLVKAEGAKVTTAVPTSISHTAWEAPAEGISAIADMLPTPSESQAGLAKASQPGPLPTLALLKTTSITQALTVLARSDRDAEEARNKLRSARSAKKAAQAAASVIVTPEASGDVEANGEKLPPGMLGERAPEVKMTKKERDKAMKQDISDEVATRNANSTATMQLGRIGKNYSWLNAGKKTSPFSTPKPLLRSLSGGAGSSATNGVQANKRQLPPGWTSADRQFGVEWREDGAEGKVIQMRDWTGVLEGDGRERRTLGWAFASMGIEREVDKVNVSAPGTPLTVGGGPALP